MKRKGKEECQVNRRSERWKGFLPRLVEVKEGRAANPKIAQRHKRGFGMTAEAQSRQCTLHTSLSC